MKNILKKNHVLFISIATLILGYVFTQPLQFGLCSNSYLFGGNLRCADDLLPSIGDSLILFSVITIVVSAALHFFRDEIFHAWLKFSYWWIPLSALIIFTTPTTDHSWALGGPTRETMSFVMSGLFLVISLILITTKSWLLRKK